MSLGGDEFTTAVTANNGTLRNDTRDWNERCYAYVQEDVGLDVCHQESFRTKDSISGLCQNVREPVYDRYRSRQLENFKRIKQTEMKQE